MQLVTMDKNIFLDRDVLIIGDFAWPTGTASANILHGHCKAITSAGYTVGILPNQSEGREQDYIGDGVCKYRDIPYMCLGCRFVRHRSRLVHYISHHFLGYDQRIDWLEHQDLSSLKAVVAYTGVTGTTSWLLRLKRLCRKRNLKLLVYVVEWHDPDHYAGGRFGICRIDGEIQRRFVNPRLDGVICISNSLHNYYQDKVCSVVVPPLLDLNLPKWQSYSGIRSTNGPIRILFSGSSKRERHDLILQAVLNVRNLTHNIVLEYLGSSRQDIASLHKGNSELIEALGEGVHFHGRVDNDQVDKIVSSASFGILLRNKEKWSESCFPSKVPEFLAYGVPIICNLTSDLGHYLENEFNAIIVRSLNVQEVEEAISKAVDMSGEERISMSRNAKESALHFDGTNFASIYRSIIG